MRRLGLMVRKDLLRQRRAPMGLLFALAFPIVFSALIALTFGARGERLARVQLLVEDRDGSFLSEMLLSALTSEQFGEYFDVRQVGEEGRSVIEQGEASALLQIPPAFGDDLLAGRPLRFELLRNPAQSILPEIAEQTFTVLADGLDAASRALRGPLNELAAMRDESNAPGPERVADIAVAAYGVIEGAEGLLFPPAITLETVQLEAPGEAASAPSGGPGVADLFVMVFPGVAVWSLFLVGDITMRDLLTEATQGTLRRQLCGPLAPREIVVAKAAATAVVATISLLLLTAIGGVVGRRGVDPAGFVLLSASVILAVTGFAATIYGGARTERQGATVSSVILLVFAFSGGTFFSIDALPGPLRAVAPVSPFYWGTEGYRSLVQGAGVAAVLQPTAILAATGVVLLSLGGWLLGRKVRHGGAA